MQSVSSIRLNIFKQFWKIMFFFIFYPMHHLAFLNFGFFVELLFKSSIASRAQTFITSCLRWSLSVKYHYRVLYLVTLDDKFSTYITALLCLLQMIVLISPIVSVTYEILCTNYYMMLLLSFFSILFISPIGHLNFLIKFFSIFSVQFWNFYSIMWDTIQYN